MTEHWQPPFATIVALSGARRDPRVKSSAFVLAGFESGQFWTDSLAVGRHDTAAKNRAVFGSGRSQTSKRPKTRFWLWHETRPGLRIAIVAIMGGKPIMTPGYVTADFAIKAGYFFVGALVLIFVGMLVLTAVHP